MGRLRRDKRHELGLRAEEPRLQQAGGHAMSCAQRLLRLGLTAGAIFMLSNHGVLFAGDGTIKIVVPVSPGVSWNTLARLLAEQPKLAAANGDASSKGCCRRF
jgi:hypothetical protein